MSSWVAAGIVLVVAALVFLIARELVCWYWKVNEGLALLRRIDGHLAKLAGEPSAAQTKPAEPNADLG